jgi:ABC-type protease/lipase transport system fused ATPase/permease subunit
VELKNYQSYLTPFILTAANTIPLIGLIMWDWDAFTILILYCIETFIIGVYNFFKILLAQKTNWGFNIFLAVFFLIHFNIFVLVQTVFVVIFSSINISELNGSVSEESEAFNELIQQSETLVNNSFLIESIAALILSHGFSFIFHYLAGKEFITAEAGKLMTEPYARIIVQQLTVILGGFAILKFTSSATFLLILLVVLKTILDLRAHIKQHKRLRSKLQSQ